MPVSHVRPSSDLTIGQVFQALWRRKGIIALVMVILGSAAYLGGSQLTPTYLAQGILAIDPRPTYLPQLGGSPPPSALDPNTVRSEAQILNSRELIATVARKLNLDRNPEFNPELRPATGLRGIANGLREGIAAAKLYIRNGRLDDPSAAGLSAEERTWSTIVSNVGRKLDVYTDGKSYVIYVNFESESPQTGAAIVNATMETFIANQIEYSASKSVETNAWIKQRATTLKAEVEEADRKVQDYRSQHGLLETRMGSVSNQQLNELNTQLGLARSDRAQAEARFREAQANTQSGLTGDATAEVLSSPLIQRLRDREAEAAQRLSEIATRLGPQHPSYQASQNELGSLRGQIAREITKVLQSLQNQVEIARSRERNLSQQLAGLQGQEMKTAGAEMELQQLTKEADTKRAVYQEFLATAQQTGEPSRIGLSLARIISNAVPPLQPHGLGGALYAAIGLFIGFLIAAAAVLMLAESRRGFDSAEEIENGLAIPVLGILPLVRAFFRREGLLTNEVKRHPSSPTAETLRGIRVALRHRFSEARQPQVILVTSALPGEGKTSFVSALGVVAAMDGGRVLIIDSDIRRPRMRRTFGRTGIPKLSDVLRGDEPLATAVYRDKKYHVDCLMASDTNHSPAALVMSGHWRALLDEARKTYDLIILDSPPVMKVVDALCLANHADAVLMIIAQGSTRQKTAHEATRRILATGCPLAGIVLSKAKAPKFDTQPYYSGYQT